MRDEFGPYFEEVELAIAHLQGLGIFYSDAKPSNINCNGVTLTDDMP